MKFWAVGKKKKNETPVDEAQVAIDRALAQDKPELRAGPGLLFLLMRRADFLPWYAPFGASFDPAFQGWVVTNRIIPVYLREDDYQTAPDHQTT